jgi:hypothetical protein|tara:strand:- start:2902 stop:3057 length:156 start_codon:yes stop_codon:yes gene_type:complete
MAEVNPKAYPLADAQLTITILDIVQQAAVRPGFFRLKRHTIYRVLGFFDIF